MSEQPSTTEFEQFPFEMFLEIFSYLDAISLYQAFFNLNSRFAELTEPIIIQRIDLRNISLGQCYNILDSVDKTKIRELILSNDYNDESVDCILNGDFKQLRHLSLECVGVFTVNRILTQSLLPIHLSSLSIKFRSDLCSQKLCTLSTTILKWCSLELSSLKHLALSTDVDEGLSNIKAPETLLSSEMRDEILWESLYLTTIRMNELEWITLCMPHIQSLTLIVDLTFPLLSIQQLPNLKKCTLLVTGLEFDTMAQFLILCPNLELLFISILDAHLEFTDDQEWQSILETHVPKLRHFTLTLDNLQFDELMIDLLRESYVLKEFWKQRNTTLNVIDQRIDEDEIVAIQIEIEFKKRK